MTLPFRRPNLYSWTWGRPPCRVCGTPTRLVLRTLHPWLGPTYAQDHYECPRCDLVDTTDLGPIE